MRPKNLDERLARLAVPTDAKQKPRPELLLLPNIPKPLHTIAPRTVLGEQWWKETRLKALRKYSFACAACGDAPTGASKYPVLECHEVYDTDFKRGIAMYIETVPLCVKCHRYIHSGFTQMLNEEGKLSTVDMEEIFRHGDCILSTNKLKRPELPERVAEWGAWVMRIPGCPDQHSRFEGYEEWYEYFNKREE